MLWQMATSGVFTASLADLDTGRKHGNVEAATESVPRMGTASARPELLPCRIA